MIEKGTIMESEAELSSKELLKIYDTALVIANDLSLKEALKSVDITQLLVSSEKVEVLHA